MTEFHKLVRDRVPERIRADGRTPVVRVLAEDELRTALLAKLVEEAAEAAAAEPQDLPEELADVVEVVRALAHGAGLSLDDVLRLAEVKRAERGGFEERLFLVRTE